VCGACRGCVVMVSDSAECRHAVLVFVSFPDVVVAIRHDHLLLLLDAWCVSVRVCARGCVAEECNEAIAVCVVGVGGTSVSICAKCLAIVALHRAWPRVWSRCRSVYLCGSVSCVCVSSIAATGRPPRRFAAVDVPAAANVQLSRHVELLVQCHRTAAVQLNVGVVFCVSVRRVWRVFMCLLLGFCSAVMHVYCIMLFFCVGVC
jgi:hypothetical protein